MRNVKKALKIMVILPSIFLLFSCNPLENDSESTSLLIVENITGTDIEGNKVNFLQSDVVRIDPVTGLESATADVADATLRASLLDAAPILGPSQYSDIILTRYVVSYSRADGKNTPGQDVPLPFEGSLSTLVKIGSAASISLVIVREVAKQEPPLINLIQGRGEGVLQVTAKVEFYGQDMVNNKVKATGYLTIFFANYIDQ